MHKAHSTTSSKTNKKKHSSSTTKGTDWTQGAQEFSDYLDLAEAGGIVGAHEAQERVHAYVAKYTDPKYMWAKLSKKLLKAIPAAHFAELGGAIEDYYKGHNLALHRSFEARLAEASPKRQPRK